MSVDLTDRSLISDTHVVAFQSLATPKDLSTRLPVPAEATAVVRRGREEISAVLSGADDRLLVITGPCSVHDPAAALDYGHRLRTLADAYADDLVVVMRTYFEKPRTTIGWKGLINDPHLDGSHDIAAGLEIARRFLIDIAMIGLPTATELLEPITPQYIAELISWAAIGARTTESQIHRQMASGLSMPVGFKNGTDGNVKIAVDAIKAASQPHHFLSVTKGGPSAIVSTAGNEDCHVILRGGKTPNDDAQSVDAACSDIGKAGLAARLMIDASHANSSKKHENQIPVCADIGRQVAAGDERIVGVMVESHLVAGRQDLKEGCALTYGQSITDACIGWDESVGVLDGLADAVKQRRVARGSGN
jgi:3-deoxy-7-phosphoheptulonate synthase